jgi:Zn ribbon nucleic-acid-binding protein
MRPTLPPEHALYCGYCSAMVTSHLWRQDGTIFAVCPRCGRHQELDATRLTVPLEQIPTRRIRVDGRQDDLFPLHGKGKP